MKDSVADAVIWVNSQPQLLQCKHVETLEGRQATLRKFFVTLRQSLAHRDIAPNKIFFFDPFHPLFVRPTVLPKDGSQEKANRRALAKVLASPKITSTVHVVFTACNLLKVLKRALRVIANLLALIRQNCHLEQPFFQFVVTERNWFKIHGPRPPRRRLKRLASCFQQVNGRVHSPLAA